MRLPVAGGTTDNAGLQSGDGIARIYESFKDNQRADNITVFRVDRKTGGLNFTGHYTPVGNPSIIVFLNLTKAG